MLRKRWVQRRRQRSLALALLAAAVGLLAIAEAFRYADAYHNVSDGKERLLTAARLMEERGLGIQGSDLDAAERSYRQARNDLDAASGTIGSDPLAFLGRRLPWLGSQIGAAEDLLDIGKEGAEIGLAAVEAMRSYQAARDSQAGPLSERVAVLLETVKPYAERMGQGLAAVEARRSALTADGLLRPIDSALADLDYHIAELRERLDNYNRGSRLAPALLGQDGPRTYLVLAHDNTEMLGSGGFILVYGLLTLDHGRITRLYFDDVHSLYFDWLQRTGEYIEPPRPLKSYLLRDWSMGLGEASWWLDFPTVAQQAIDLYRRESGSEERVDGAIGINFYTLEKLLAVTGPVTVAEYGVTVDSGNVTEQTLIVTHPEAARPWETDRYDFAAYLAESVIDRAMGIGPSQWTAMLEATNTLGEEKNLLLYLRDPEAQQAVAELGWDGRVQPGEGDYLMVVDSSLNSTKLNLVVQPSIDLTVSLDDLGNARNTVAVTYSNDYSTWARDQDPHLAALVTGQNSLTVYGDYLRLLVPAGSSLVEVREDDAAVGAEAVSPEHGKTVLGRYFALPIDSRKTLTFSYTVPAALDTSQDPFVYRLLVQKQPGTAAVPLRIKVQAPRWARPVSLELDGQPAPLDSLGLETDLRRDRKLVVRLDPQRSDIPRREEE
jgi:hypothetical protein